jgi:hypothetical protein
MTYELDQEIFGWTRHFTGLGVDAGFESVCCIQGSATADDEVWCVVNRVVNGANVRFVERLNPINWQTIVANQGGTPGYTADKDQAYYVDCGRTFTSPLSNVFPGFSHLAGRMVSVCINAQDYGQFLVSQAAGTFVIGNTYQIISVGTTNWAAIGGSASPAQGQTFVATGAGSGTGTAGGDVVVPSFTPPGSGESVAQIGLPFTSTLQPQNIDIDEHTGVTQGITKKVTGLFVSLFNTLALKVTAGQFKTVVDAGGFTVGQTYTIISIGNTDFTQIGATANVVGLVFTATGAGTGNGTAGQNQRIKEVEFASSSNIFAETPLYSGVQKILDFQGDYGLSIPIIMYTDGPLPMTILGVAVSYNPAGRP